MITSEQLKTLREREQALRGAFDIDAKQQLLKEEEAKTQQPGFWDDPKGEAGLWSDIVSVVIP
jgi:peptide chain release factor 2